MFPRTLQDIWQLQSAAPWPWLSMAFTQPKSASTWCPLFLNPIMLSFIFKSYLEYLHYEKCHYFFFIQVRYFIKYMSKANSVWWRGSSLWSPIELDLNPGFFTCWLYEYGLVEWFLCFLNYNMGIIIPTLRAFLFFLSEIMYMLQTICLPPTFVCWNWTPKVTVLGCGGFGRW